MDFSAQQSTLNVAFKSVFRASIFGRSYAHEKDNKPSPSNLHLQKQSNKGTKTDEKKPEGNNHKKITYLLKQSCRKRIIDLKFKLAS